MKEIVWLDTDFIAHRKNDGTVIPFETDFFVGKCDKFVEGHRCVPKGYSWTREDGEVFNCESGEMICMVKPYAELDAAQREYEKQLLAEYAEALKVVGVSV